MFFVHVICALLTMSVSLKLVKCPLNVPPPSKNIIEANGASGLNTRFIPKIPFKTEADDNFEPEVKSITFPFIEAIVQRTVNEYMRVIRTERNWLERILQLVREERVIRSRYNCSTDACIYKIQLFTHHLPAYLLQPKPILRRRVRRSAPIVTDDRAAQQQDSLSSTNRTSANHSIMRTPSPSEILLRRSNRSVNEAAVSAIKDDALRLPDHSKPKDTDENFSKSTVNAQIDMPVPLSSPINFGDNEKINMERVSQEVLSEALSREAKLINQKPPLHMEDKQKFTETSDSVISTEEINRDLKLLTDMPELETDSNNDVTDLKPSATTTLSTEKDIRNPEFIKQSRIEIETISDEDSVLTHLEVSAAGDQKQEGMEKYGSAEEKSEQLEYATPTTVESRDAQLLRYEVREAIPFGLNQFAGKAYENCTGRYQHYCYNALKCLYISVLETAVCYCRTGYTGVRCDMFNLPQTLDILKSFREEMVDIPSLHKRNADTLYGVVEATARYTVNAVIEEDLIASWNNDVP